MLAGKRKSGRPRLKYITKVGKDIAAQDCAQLNCVARGRGQWEAVMDCWLVG